MALSTTTKPVDVALLRAAKHMVACMERDTACYIQAAGLKASLEKRLATFSRRHPHAGSSLSQSDYAKKEAIRSNWETSGEGLKWCAAWTEFQSAADASSKACTRVIRHTPKSLAGAAYVALAAIGRYNTTGPGYGYLSDECTLLIAFKLFEAAGLRLPPSVRRAVKMDPGQAAMLRRYGC